MLYNTGNMKGHLCYNILESLCRNENLHLLQWRTSDWRKKSHRNVILPFSNFDNILFHLAEQILNTQTKWKPTSFPNNPSHNTLTPGNPWGEEGKAITIWCHFLSSFFLLLIFYGVCGVLVVVTITSITSKQILTQP